MKATRAGLVLLLGTATSLAACAIQSTPTPATTADTRAADEKALRDTDMAWSKSAEQKSADVHIAYYTDDAVVMPANAPLATGREPIRKLIGDLYALPGMSVKWTPSRVDVAKSGDIGYTQGTYELTVNDAQGKPTTEHGKYLEVWKKQADGSWKCAVDTFNSDEAAAPPPK